MADFNIVTDILLPAFSALIVSLIVSYIDTERANKDLLSNYFNESFQNIIVIELPEKIDSLNFVNGILTDDSFDDLNDVIKKLIKKSKYYSQFAGNNLYKKMKKQCVLFQDYIHSVSNRTILLNLQSEVFDEIQKNHVKEIFNLLNKEYLN